MSRYRSHTGSCYPPPLSGLQPFFPTKGHKSSEAPNGVWNLQGSYGWSGDRKTKGSVSTWQMMAPGQCKYPTSVHAWINGSMHRR